MEVKGKGKELKLHRVTKEGGDSERWYLLVIMVLQVWIMSGE